jgi:hypothetical protein
MPAPVIVVAVFVVVFAAFAVPAGVSDCVFLSAAVADDEVFGPFMKSPALQLDDGSEFKMAQKNKARLGQSGG